MVQLLWTHNATVSKEMRQYGSSNAVHKAPDSPVAFNPSCDDRPKTRNFEGPIKSLYSIVLPSVTTTSHPWHSARCLNNCNLGPKVLHPDFSSVAEITDI
jgi:hypothetical protein